MITFYDDMVLQENNTYSCCENKDILAQYVEDVLKILEDVPTWTITIGRENSGASYAQTVTTAWSEGILMLPYSEEQRII